MIRDVREPLQSLKPRFDKTPPGTQSSLRMRWPALILSLAAFLYAVAPAFAEERTLLSREEEPAFLLNESDSAHGTHVTLIVQLPPATTVSTLVLEHPLRVVIDMPPSKNVKNTGLNVDKHTMVSALRIGVHQDKLRFVLDLRGKTTPQVSVSESARGTEIDVFVPGTPEAQPTEAPTATPEPVATVQVIVPEFPTEVPESIVTEVPQTSAPLTEEPTATQSAATATTVPTSTPTATNTPAPTNTEAPTPSATATPPQPTATATPLPVPPTAPPIAVASEGPRLLEFKFEYNESDKTPVIRISLSERSQFTLSKADERLYKLTIPGTQLATLGLKLPQFPPHDFAGFTFLQAEQRESNAEVKIGVERGARISALPQENDILVRIIK